MGRDFALYEFGSIRIDSRTRRIEREGQAVPLPSRAFDLLLLLIERRGELVSKEELLSRAWTDTHVEESNLPVVISAIRRAIGDDGRHQKFIQTVSKSGYRFIGEVRELPVEAKTPVAEGNAGEVEPVTSGAGMPWRESFPSFAATAALALLALFVVSGGSIIAGRYIATVAKPVSSEQTLARARAEMWLEKGDYAWNLQTRSGMLQSLEYYQNAIAEDDSYAPGYAGLAVAYVSLPSYSEGPGDEEFTKARAAASKAVALDQNLGRAHIARGMVFLIVDRNFARGAEEVRKATALDPRSSLAEGELALCLVAVGRTDEAVMHARRAKALDPLSIRAATDLGIVLYYGHRYTEAETEFEDILKLDPYSYRTHVNLGKTYLKLARFDDARRVLEQASTLSNNDPLADGLRAETEGLSGNTEAARTILASLEQRAKAAYIAPVCFAYAYVGLGRPDEALKYLAEARAKRSIAALFLSVDPTWEILRGKPGFAALTKGISLSGE